MREVKAKMVKHKGVQLQFENGLNIPESERLEMILFEIDNEYYPDEIVFRFDDKNRS